MAITEKLELDTRSYMQSLSSAEKAALRHARKQESAYNNARQTMQELERDIQSMERAIQSANSPEVVKRYQKALDSLKQDYKELEGATKRYERSVKDVGTASVRSAGSVTQSFKRIGGAAKLFIAGSAATALYGLARAFGAVATEQVRFDKAMNQSLAIQSEVTQDQRDRMVETARTVAKELNMTTDEVAAGYFYLASAGLDAEQQIENLGAVAQFAKAGMFDLATATDLATDAQSALGLTVDNVYQNQANLIRVTDVLAKANSMANATIQQFSEALTNKGATALKNYNKDIEEGVAVLAAYADQGIKANIAGERLNILLKRLAESAQRNGQAFEDMNVSVFDQQGTFRSLPDIIADLEGALDGLSDQQRNATLAQLGFTAETQDSILPLIGLSDQLKIYEANLKSAAGTTQEIADNQMQSLSERFIALKRQVIDLFGDDVLSLLEKFADNLETVGRAIDKIQAKSERKSVIQSIIGDAGAFERAQMEVVLYPEYEKQQKQTEMAAFNMQNTLREIAELEKSIVEMPVFEERGNELIKEKVALLKNARDTYKGNQRVLENRIKYTEDDVAAQAKLKLALIENNKRLKEAERVYRQAERAASDYTKQVASEPPEIPRPERQSFREMEPIVLRQPVEIDIRDMSIKPVADKVADLMAEFDKAGDAADQYRQRLSKLFQSAGQAGEFSADLAAQFAAAFSRLNELSIGDEGVLREDVDNLIESYRWAQQQITELNEQGLITDIEMNEGLQSTGIEMRKQLQDLYKTAKKSGDMAPEVRAAFERAFKAIRMEIEQTDKKIQQINLQELADAVSGIMNLADAFGLLNDKIENSLRSTIDLLRNVQNLRQLEGTGLLGLGGTGFGGAIAGVGIAASIGGLLANILQNNGGGMSAAELNELNRSLEENRRAIERNTSALLADSVVGGGLNTEQVSGIRDIFESLRGLANRSMLPDQSNIIDQLFQLQNALSDAGMNVDLINQFNDLVNSGMTNSEALRSVLGLFSQGFGMGLGTTEGGLTDNIQQLLDSFGQYSDTLDGIIRQFNDSLRFGIADTDTALQTFVDRLRGLGTAIPEELLDQIAGLNLSTEAGQNALDEIISELFSGQAGFLGDLTPDEFTQLLDFLQGIGDGPAATPEGISRSVQAVASITEFQANEIVVLSEAQLFVQQQILDHLRSTTQSTISRVPDSPPVMSNINLGGINVSGGLSQGQIEGITDMIANELKRLNQGGQFG